MRIALWWGLAAIVVVILAWNLLLPLSGLTGHLLTGALIGAALLGWATARPHDVQSHLNRTALITLIVIVIASFASAFLALGIPINYDTGLYHLGAINYANEFATVPGLANVHDRFGFNSSVFPLAAGLDGGLWSGQGFRIITGIALLAASLDLLLRLFSNSQVKPSRSGTTALALGLGVTWTYALLTPGSSLASPNSDVIAALLIVVASAYLVDAIHSDTPSSWLGATAVLLAALAATTRPLNWAYLGLVGLVVWGVAQRRQVSVQIVIASAFSFILLLLMLVRDTLLSGWLLFPLTLAPMPVDWRFPSPGTTSAAITAWGRAPHQSIEESLDGWSWFVPWLSRTASDEFLIFTAIALMVFGILFVTGKERRSRLYWAVVPSIAVLPLWFVTAPDPRFVWGQILTTGTIPLAVAWTQRTSTDTLVIAASALLATAVIATAALSSYATVIKDVRPFFASIGPVTWEMESGPVIESDTKRTSFADGTPTIESSGDQCWAAFPLCRPGGSSPAVEKRGSDISDGFRSTLSP